MMKKPFLLLTTALLLVFGMSSKLYAQDDLIRTLGMGSLECIAYSPDGTKLVSAGHSGYIYIWDINSGEVIDTLKGHNSRVYSVAFSPDGTKLASGGSDKTIKLWDVNTGALIRTFEGHTNWVNSVAFSPDGSMLASGSSDGTIRIWRIPPPTSVESDFNNKNELIAFPQPLLRINKHQLRITNSGQSQN